MVSNWWPIKQGSTDSWIGAAKRQEASVLRLHLLIRSDASYLLCVPTQIQESGLRFLVHSVHWKWFVPCVMLAHLIVDQPLHTRSSASRKTRRKVQVQISLRLCVKLFLSKVPNSWPPFVNGNWILAKKMEWISFYSDSECQSCSTRFCFWTLCTNLKNEIWNLG